MTLLLLNLYVDRWDEYEAILYKKSIYFDELERIKTDYTQDLLTLANNLYEAVVSIKTKKTSTDYYRELRWYIRHDFHYNIAKGATWDQIDRIYDDLRKTNITALICVHISVRRQHPGTYDLIISADEIEVFDKYFLQIAKALQEDPLKELQSMLDYINNEVDYTIKKKS